MPIVAVIIIILLYYIIVNAISHFVLCLGYMYGQDDMIINWWTFTQLDRLKMLHGTKVVDWRQDAYKSIIQPQWIWWTSYMGIEACRNYYSHLKRLSRRSSKDGKQCFLIGKKIRIRRQEETLNICSFLLLT